MGFLQFEQSSLSQQIPTFDHLVCYNPLEKDSMAWTNIYNFSYVLSF